MKSRIGNPLVDCSQTIPFEFDGKKYCGHPGDTLASALLANGVKVFGRSFKYHRPRGVFGDGVEEPNALMQIGDGAFQSPNIRATEAELSLHLTARSQNHLGSLHWDFLRVNDFFSPFLGAGFYYKTFMWPKSFWEKIYEPMIRRAAGLGALSGEEDRQKYERGFLFCDVLVIGSGLAGLEAALLAGEAGADVILMEGDYEFGGRLIKDQGEVDGLSYRDWRDQALQRLEAMENVRLMKRAHVVGVYDGGVYGVLERGTDLAEAEAGRPRQSFWRVRAREAILAAGGQERPIAFQNNDRPGVMLASSVRAYLNRFGVAVGEKIAIFTNNDEGWKLARDMEALGLAPVAVIDPREDHGQRGGFPVFRGVVKNAKGMMGLQSVLVEVDGKQQKVLCDCLAVSGGFNPNVHLSSHLGAKPVYDESIAAFVPPQEHVPHLHIAGGCAGKFADADILASAFDAAQNALGAIGLKAKAQKHEADATPYHVEALWAVAGKGRAFLDLQNDVSVKDVQLAHRENFGSVEHMKRYTTLGMATDQGKTGNVNALGAMAELAGQSMGAGGTTTFRPPFVPVPVAAFGAGGVGKGFAAERFTPSHELSASQGVVFTEAGLWYRQSYFPKAGDTVWRQACDREVTYVREAVGVCDASTLGKILLQGKDAARFLDLVYTGKMSSLAEGRIRYGLMLREDGMVMDDGTCANLGEGRYLITTTTAFAGEVMNHFDFVSQCLMPDADVQYISMTDHYAQFAVAGPEARALLEAFIEDDISDAALPFMGLKPVKIGGVAATLYRISFSGELGFEIALPRRYGENLMGALAKKAREMGGGLYGLEALNVMRIEKGFITHAEIDGRVTAKDLGLGKMVSAKKDCIGKVMAARPELQSEKRRQLVGLKPIGAVQRLLAGSVMLAEGAEAKRENLQGYVSSVCYSPILGHMIGLGFVEGGQARMGDKIRAVDLVRDFDTLCEIVNPVFLDPEGERLRG